MHARWLALPLALGLCAGAARADPAHADLAHDDRADAGAPGDAGSPGARDEDPGDGEDSGNGEDGGTVAPGTSWSLDLTVHEVGIALGNPVHVDGLRLNFRDFSPAVVHGVNLTLWSPADQVGGEVIGLALGLPVTGSGSLDGVSLGLFGVGANRRLSGVAIGGLGVGGGGDLDGVMLGGLGAGCGGAVRGLAVGGLGIGAGGDLEGVMLGGLGAGAGGSVTGLALGGLGVGAGGDVTGLALGGIGVGSGGTLRGVAIAAVGVGAPALHGLSISAAAGSDDLVGVAIAPAYLRIGRDGELHGFAVSAFNHISGEQDGLVIGIFNYAAELHGVQLGLLNWAGNNRSGLKLLPIANAHFD